MSATESLERNLIRLLVENFRDSPSEMLGYLKQAGYDDESKLAGVLLRTQLEAEHDAILGMRFDVFMKKSGYSKKNLKALAKKEEERRSIRVEAIKKRWEQEEKKVQAAAKKRSAEIAEIYSKHNLGAMF